MRRFLVLSVAAWLTVSANAQSSKPDFTTVRTDIAARMAATATPSMAVAVAHGPDVIWADGFGWIDRPGGTAATPDTLYYVASVTKTIAATALMVLHDRKQLDLDKPANSYLRRAKLRSPHWNADEVTLRQLATHTGGLGTFDFNGSVPGEEVIRRYGIVFTRPGNRYNYSNLGFGVIGQIIADVSGRPFQQFVHDEVLRPLGMEDAWAGATPQTRLPVAPRYSALLRDFSPPLSEPTLPGASVLFSSVRELMRFGMFHLQTHTPNRPLLSAESIHALQEPSVVAGSARQSLAWSIAENRHGYRTLLAQGGTLDSQAWLLLVPSEKIVVAVLANYGSAPAAEMIDQVLSSMLPAYRESLARTEQPPAPSASPRPGLPATFTGKWSGRLQTHRANLPFVLTVHPTGEIDATLAQQGTVKMADVRLQSGGRLSGRIRGDLGLDDTGKAPYELRLDLQQVDNKIFGAAVTYALQGYEGPRLPFWVELKR